MFSKMGVSSDTLEYYSLPGDFRSWQSPQALLAPFIRLSKLVKWFQNLKFIIRGYTNIHTNVLISSKEAAASDRAFNQTETNSLIHYTEMGRQSFATKKTVIG